MTPTPDPLTAALAHIQEICKPMDFTTSGPRWFVDAGGGTREKIWRICDAALKAQPAPLDVERLAAAVIKVCDEQGLGIYRTRHGAEWMDRRRFATDLFAALSEPKS